MDDRSVLTAAALDLDGQDAVHAVHVVNEPAVANPSGLHPELSHFDNAAASFAHDAFHAENDLHSKLADFGPQQGDGFPIAASEQVERAVTHIPVGSSHPVNLTPDHPAPQQVSTAAPTALAHSDTTVTPENPLQRLGGKFVLRGPGAAQRQATSTDAPAAEQNQVASTDAPAAQQNQVASTDKPAAQQNQGHVDRRAGRSGERHAVLLG